MHLTMKVGLLDKLKPVKSIVSLAKFFIFNELTVHYIKKRHGPELCLFFFQFNKVTD